MDMIEEVSKLALGPNGILVIHYKEKTKLEVWRMASDLRKQLAGKFPDWCGIILLLNDDLRIEALPEMDARMLYENLRKRFEPSGSAR